MIRIANTGPATPSISTVDYETSIGGLQVEHRGHKNENCYSVHRWFPRSNQSFGRYRQFHYSSPSILSIACTAILIFSERIPPPGPTILARDSKGTQPTKVRSLQAFAITVL
jgi:hypothetical protein